VPHAIIEVGGGSAGVRTSDGIYGRRWSREGERAFDPDAAPFRYDLRSDPFELTPMPQRDAAGDAILERWIATTPWRQGA
jgi:hypothetical protein